MVCGNCFITHALENCIIDGSIFNEGTNLVDVLSLLDRESSEGGIISLTNDDEYAGLHTIPETPCLNSWRESEPSEETKDSQPATDETLPTNATQGVSLQQVMMIELVGTTTAATS